MSTTDLFLSTFGSKKPDDNGQPARNVGDTTDLFLAAFGHDSELKNYTPEPILDYELNAKAGTDTGKLFTLDAYMKDGVQYRDLPMGLRELVKPKRPLAKELRQQEDETGMNLEQRENEGTKREAEGASEPKAKEAKREQKRAKRARGEETEDGERMKKL